MPARRRVAPGRRDRLSFAHLSELVLGPGGRLGGWANFADDAAARRAYTEHKAEVMSFGNPRPGRRPAAWWIFDAPSAAVFVLGRDEPPESLTAQLDLTEAVDQVTWLAHHGHLAPAEQAAIKAEGGPRARALAQALRR